MVALWLMWLMQAESAKMKPQLIEDIEGASQRCGTGRLIFSSVTLEGRSRRRVRHHLAEILQPARALSCSTSCPRMRHHCVGVRLTVCVRSWLKIRLLMMLMKLTVTAGPQLRPLQHLNVPPHVVVCSFRPPVRPPDLSAALRVRLDPDRLYGCNSLETVSTQQE